jgi:hypothetical protein
MHTKRNIRTIYTTVISLDEAERFELHKRWGSQSMWVDTVTMQVSFDDSDLDDPPKPSIHIVTRGRRLLKHGRTNDQVLSEGFYPSLYHNQPLPAALLAVLDAAKAELPLDLAEMSWLVS